MPVTRDHSETMLRDPLDISTKEETANVPGEPALSFESEETPGVLDAGVPAGLKSGMAMGDFSTAASSGSPAQPLPAANGTEDRRQGEIGMEGPVAQPSDSDVEGFLRSNHQARRSMTSEASLNDMMRAEPDDSPSLTGKSEEGSFSEPPRSPAVVTKDGGASTQGHGGDADRPLDQTTPSPSYLSEIRYRDEKFALAEEKRRAEQPAESGDRTADLGRFKHDADSVREEMESIQKSKTTSAGDQDLIAHRFGMTAANESATQSNSGNSGDPQRQADPMPKPQRSSVHGSDGDGPGPVSSRSVAFEVSRPDLGHVNVRVAVRNDLVHAHLSSDRLDVAQYLAAGHDRLQSALQANGLEMGQFRVDVDRHGAGRSFHQGPSYDQDRTWQPERPAPDQRSMMPESRTYTGIPYAGMLNVVA
ncbi:MAG: flagellar hook-length control protein FliK [Nitrospira sp.]|nr:flagellar hook-length control protein FliK [Nitrospira sp.]